MSARIAAGAALLAIALAPAGASAGAASARASAASAGCSYVAAPSGARRGPATAARPLRSVQALVDRLRPGQTGCLRGGVYRESVTIGRGGTSDARRVTLESYPGERATLLGRLYLRRSAPFVTVANINLNGRNRASLPSPMINSTGARFVGDDVTDEHTEICFLLGSPGYGRAIDTAIEGTRIHDCGLQPSRNEDHGIYVAFADNTQIVGNVIFDNTDRGIQLYPDAQGTVIEHNVIDGNGENVEFGGEGTSSSDTLVAFNLITDARIRDDVESYYPRGTPPGSNNVVRDNCIFGGAGATIAHESGFVAGNLGNRKLDPHYRDPAGGDYTVPATNACATYLTPGIPLLPF